MNVVNTEIKLDHKLILGIVMGGASVPRSRVRGRGSPLPAGAGK